MKREVLTDAELAEAVASLDGWDVSDGMLRRSVTAPSFLAGIEFVRSVAEIAEELDHHPDIDIRWRTVSLALSTHDRGGITDVDIEAAHRFNTIPLHPQ